MTDLSVMLLTALVAVAAARPQPQSFGSAPSIVSRLPSLPTFSYGSSGGQSSFLNSGSTSFTGQLPTFNFNSASPPSKSRSPWPELTPVRTGGPPASSALASANAAGQALDSRLGVGGSWNPKAVGIRVYQSPNKNFKIAVGGSTDFHSNHAAGFGLKVNLQ